MSTIEFNVSLVILIVTTLVSIISIIFGILNLAFQRSHNKKSVKPFCNVHKQLTDNSICISLINAGLGPMIINKVNLVKGENEVMFSEVLPYDLNLDYVVNNSDVYVLPSMGEIKLLQYTTRKTDDICTIKNKLDGYYIYIEYQDIYDRKFTKKDLIAF